MKKREFGGFSPVCKHHYLYLYELGLEVSIHVVEPVVAIRSVVYDRPVDIQPMEESVAARWGAGGDRLFVAYHGDTAVGHLYAATGECLVGEVDDKLCIEENEVYFYAAYTKPEFRGNRIYPYLVTMASEYFKRKSYEYAMIFSTGNNVKSRKGIERSGFSVYEKVDYWNLLGWKSWRITVGDRHVRSRLRVEC